MAEALGFEDRDRAVVAWVGLAPDLDGFGAAADIFGRVLGFGDPALYGRFHHVLLHGLFGALLTSGIGVPMARRRWATFFAGVAAVHLHLACDLVGSRGPTAGDIWPIQYLGPFTEAWTLSWSGQWPLNAWPNLLVTLGLLAYVFVRAATVGHTPVSLLSTSAHEAFVRAVQGRWRRTRGTRD